MKRIGIITSGGDSPGMNAAVRAVIRTACINGIEVYGFNRGYKGIHEKDYVVMNRFSVSNIIQQGGSILYSSRFPEFKDRAIREECYANLRELGIEGFVACGGDGTLRGAQNMVDESGIKAVGLPGTIDNDLAGSDYTIGYDTALNTALEAIDKIRDTAATMERMFIIEVMGRHSGYLALDVAVAGGAEGVLVPEIDHDDDTLIARLKGAVEKGRRNFIVVVAEGDEAGGAQKFAERVHEELGLKSWVSIIGYIQRGGNPSGRDRILSTKLGADAVESLMKGQSGFLVGEVNGEIIHTPFKDAWTGKKPLDKELLDIMFRLSQ